MAGALNNDLVTGRACGPSLGSTKSSCWPPMSLTSSSLTTLTSCWSGRTPLTTLTPSAAASTLATNLRTIGRLTCARPGSSRGRG